ncbi:MAG: hypothetical protein ACJ8DY_02170 [Xanthobacteraceae bacterium]
MTGALPRMFRHNQSARGCGLRSRKVDAAFFADGRTKSNFLCNLGRDDPAKIFERLPRFTSTRYAEFRSPDEREARNPGNGRPAFR